MLVRLIKVNGESYKITVEELKTGTAHVLTCPLGIFQHVQAWGPGTFMEVEQQDGIVKNVVRRDPFDSQGAYR